MVLPASHAIQPCSQILAINLTQNQGRRITGIQLRGESHGESNAGGETDLVRRRKLALDGTYGMKAAVDDTKKARTSSSCNGRGEAIERRTKQR